MHDNRIQASGLCGVQNTSLQTHRHTQTHMHTHWHARGHREGMNWNGQELTADSNEIHYVGVKEVTNNIRQGLPSEHGG